MEQEELENKDSNYLIESLTELKNNTVSKEKYQEQVDINKKLLSSMMDGSLSYNDNDTKDEPSLEELRLGLLNSKTNLEYAKNVLLIRKALIEKGERDPFLPNAYDYVPSAENVATANKVAEVLNQCIEESEGNSVNFNAAFNKLVAPVQFTTKK